MQLAYSKCLKLFRKILRNGTYAKGSTLLLQNLFTFSQRFGSSMRIGFFSPTITRVGGGEWVTLNMIHALNSTEHEIIVCSAEKIDVHQLQNFFGKSLRIDSEVNFWLNLFDPFDLENIYPNIFKSSLFSFKCDLLIDTFSNDLFPWTDAVYYQGTPRTLRLHKRILFWPYKALSTNTSRHCKSEDKILIACSKHSARTIENFTGLSVKVLYPPVSDYFKIKNDTDRQRKNRVVTLIRIAEDKRPSTIPQIAKLVSTDATFTIVGNCRTIHEMNMLCSLRETIRKLDLGERITLLLNVSREKQREILQSSKVYLHPFVPYESFGVSTLEAMSAGCIPVVPDIAGLREIAPKELRYRSIEEAASLVDTSIDMWSPQKAREIANSTNRFSQARFAEEFLKIIKL